MTTGSWVVLVLAVVASMADLVAVGRRNKSLEYLCKPLAMGLILVAGLLVEPTNADVRTWFVIGFALSLAGDVFLMLPERPLGPVDTFIAGLGSFLLGHIAYVVGFAVAGADLVGRWWVLFGVVALFATAGQRIVRGARATDAQLLVPVTLYMAVISAMAAFSVAVGNAWGIVGALLFVLSDAILGWNRFVREFDRGHMAVMATYLSAQMGLLLSLT